MEDKHLHLQCDCYTHILSLTKTDKEGVYISIYGAYKGEKMRWRDRLRLIWTILTTGIPYEDQVIINEEKVRELYNFLS